LLSWQISASVTLALTLQTLKRTFALPNAIVTLKSLRRRPPHPWNVPPPVSNHLSMAKWNHLSLSLSLSLSVSLSLCVPHTPPLPLPHLPPLPHAPTSFFFFSIKQHTPSPLLFLETKTPLPQTPQKTPPPPPPPPSPAKKKKEKKKSRKLCLDPCFYLSL